MSVWKAILLFILFGTLVVFVVFVVLNIKEPDTNMIKNKSPLNYSKSELNSNDINSDDMNPSNVSNVLNYITPYNFKVGDLPRPQPLSNMCENDGIMYPNNGLNPKYPPFKTSESSIQYIQAP